MRRSLAIGAAVILLLALVAYLQRGAIALALMERFVNRAVAQSTFDALPDGLHAAFCGTGSPLPDRDRAGPCFAVVAGKRLFVFDAGEGSAETLSLMGLAPARVERVFLTHLHSDHIDGLGALALQRWAGGSAHTTLPLYGPVGVERVAAGFNEAYLIDSGYRTAHHGPEVAPPDGYGLAPLPFVFAEREERQIVYDEGGVRVIAFKVAHAPTNGVGYRVEYGEHALVVSGDTAKTEAIVREARGADLLVHEALSPRLVGMLGSAAARNNQPGVAKIMSDILDYHATPEDAAAQAQEAGATALAITHQIPPLRLGALEGPFLGDARTLYRGRLWIMHDGDLISITAAGLSRRNLL